MNSDQFVTQQFNEATGVRVRTYLSRRQLLRAAVVGGAVSLGTPRVGWAAETDDPLGEWRSDVKIQPVSKIADRHTMHTYYLLNPESPDGKKVLFFASTDRSGQVGQICVLDRQTGIETVLADGVHTEDAHRVAL